MRAVLILCQTGGLGTRTYFSSRTAVATSPQETIAVSSGFCYVSLIMVKHKLLAQQGDRLLCLIPNLAAIPSCCLVQRTTSRLL